MGAALGLAAAGQAQGAEAVRRWRLSPDTVERSLIALALQAKISIGGDIGRCQGRAAPWTPG